MAVTEGVMPIFTGHHEDRWLQARLICGDMFAIVGVAAALMGYSHPIILWFGFAWYAIALLGRICR